MPETACLCRYSIDCFYNLKTTTPTMSLKILKKSSGKFLTLFVFSNIVFLFLCSCNYWGEIKNEDVKKDELSFFKSKVSFLHFILDANMKPNAVYSVRVNDMEHCSKSHLIKSETAMRKLITLLRNARFSPPLPYLIGSDSKYPKGYPPLYTVLIQTRFFESDESFHMILSVHKRTAEISIYMSNYKIDETSHKKILELIEEQIRESHSNQQDDNNENK
jgi:hypothetical protein